MRRWLLVGAVGIAYAVVGAWTIVVRGYALVPDVYCYARGSCAWSSPYAAAEGAIAGMVGLRVFALVAVVLLGLAVGLLGSPRRALVLLSAMVALPGVPGLAIGPDAAGAALVVLAYAQRARWWWLPAVAHLEAALCLGCAKLAAGWPGVRSPWVVAAAGVGAMAALALIGELRFHELPAEVQWRYLLPGAATIATYAGRREAAVEDAFLAVSA